MARADWFQRGVLLFNAGRVRRARRFLVAAVGAGGPQAPWACLQLVATYVQHGEASTASAEIEVACRARRDLRDLAIGSLLSGGAAANDAIDRARVSPAVRWPASLELARIRLRAGDNTGARTLLDACRRHFADGDDRWGLASTLARQAELSLQQHRPARAIELARQAATLRHQTGDQLGLGFALQLQAKGHYLQADYVAAMDRLRMALAIHRACRHRVEWAATLNNIGLWQLDLANPHLAQAAFTEARRWLRRLGDRRREGITLANLGNAARQLGQLSLGERYYRRALELLNGGDANAHGIAVAELAAIHTGRGRPQSALITLRTPTLGAGRRTRLLLDLARARAHLAGGEHRRALRESGRCLRTAHELPGTDLTRLLSTVEAQTIHAAALLAAGQPIEAVAASRHVCRLIDSLLGRQSSRAVRMGLVETYREAQDILCQSVITRTSARRAWMAVSRFKARELGSLATSRVRSSARSGQALPADTAILEYHTSHSTTHVFTIHGGRVQILELGIGALELTRTLARTLAPFRAVGQVDADPLTELETFDLSLSRGLFDRLLAPAIAGLPAVARRLVVVPDGPLHGLPFEALVIGDRRRPPPSHPAMARFDAPEYVMERYIVSYALSSRQRCDGGSRTDGDCTRFLGLAYSPRRGHIRTPEGPYRLAPLAGVAAECRAAARHFPSGTLLTGAAATVAAYSEHAPAADVIHIAAHATADDRGPGLSGVVVAANDGEPFGFLTAERIRATPIRSRLVVLSACDTGRGQLRTREGALGLGRAFLDAGASAVLVTHWPVDDGATRELMTDLYRLLRTGVGPAVALTLAKRRLRNCCDRHLFPIRAHPFFWGSFVLVER